MITVPQESGSSDNLSEISKLFDCRQDPRYAGGYSYFCIDCDLECNTGEALFDCKCGLYLPTYIICRYGCGRSWRLQIQPVPEEGH